MHGYFPPIESLQHQTKGRKHLKMTRLIHTTRALFGAALIAALSLTASADMASDILAETDAPGGVMALIGAGDSALPTTLAAEIAAEGRFIVDALDTDYSKVLDTRRRIAAQGLQSRATATLYEGTTLPYPDNLLNVVASAHPGRITDSEIMRVLAPEGVAYIKRKGQWTKTVKPRPAEIDEWTHYLRDASGNAVAQDTVVGPPRRTQWTASPSWSRNHHKLASISSVVTSNGRLFYIVDEGPSALPSATPSWYVAGRDAFNGALLWKRPMDSWANHTRKFRSGPVQLPRTLVAVDDMVFAPLGLNAAMSVLDAKTGELLRQLPGTDAAEEIIVDGDLALVVTGAPVVEHALDTARLEAQRTYPNTRSIVALNAKTGEGGWRWTAQPGEDIVPLTLATNGGNIYFESTGEVVCLDRASGKEVWRGGSQESKPTAKAKAPKIVKRAPGTANSTLVVYDDYVLLTDGKRMLSLSAKTGDTLWQDSDRAGFRSPNDIFVIGGLAWVGNMFAEGRDLKSGEVVRHNGILPDIQTAGHHHRCYREKATSRYIITSYRGAEFCDMLESEHSRNNWVRGVCQYGFMPANGLLYSPPHACGCFMEAKLRGFWALAPEETLRKPTPTAERLILIKGEAYGKRIAASSKANDWPTLRGDSTRSGSRKAALPTQLGTAWKTTIGGEISAPVAAEGVILVAQTQARTIVALDANDGSKKWEYVAGGRVDSAPTIHNGLALFGCADGTVTCLRLSDGARVWRFMAAPEQLRTLAYDQMESVWPVAGNVLVQNGVAYVSAGRSTYLDGGMMLYGLDPATGKVVHKTALANEHAAIEENTGNVDRKKLTQNATDIRTFNSPDKSDAFSMEGNINDVLVGDGSNVFLRHMKFDRAIKRQDEFSRHLFSTSALLDDAENHRSHWVLGSGDFSRTPVAYSWIANRGREWSGVGLNSPYGMFLSFDDETAYCVRSKWGSYTLYAQATEPVADSKAMGRDFVKFDRTIHWEIETPLRPRAMIHAADKLFITGIAPIEGNPTGVWENPEKGALWIASTKDGATVNAVLLDSWPVWDGMAAIGDDIIVSMADGSVVCLAGAPK